MFELMDIVKAAPQSIVQGTNSSRSIAADLLQDRDVHAHMEKGIGIIVIDRELPSQSISRGKNAMIFRMRFDDAGD